MSSLVSRQLKNLYKISPMREGILNWYPFAKDSAVLERSGGTLTPLLRTRCASVMSFDLAYTRDSTFDYLVCIDPGEITVELLATYRRCLNAHGRLLMAFDNPYGLQYFSGKRNPRTDLPFTFWCGESKKEVSIRLKQAGFAGQKWYYPFNNHYFTREVYSENYLPNEFLNHRGYAYIEDDFTKEFDERALWNEVIRGGAFAFLCNAYLVEACVDADDAPCVVDFAAITAYREREKAFITTVRYDGTARKQAVFSEGIVHLNAMLENHNDLARLGVNVLPVIFENGYLAMKRLELPTLWDYWAERLIKGELAQHELFSHFDRIRDSIYKAAKDGRCYWEMVPANCFFNSETDEMIFFDQEYYWQDVDPDMALVRAMYALKYSVIFRKDPRTGDWINALKEKYNLVGKWDCLIEIADKDTKEFVFNKVCTKLFDSAVEQARVHVAERVAEHRRHYIMCEVAVALQSMGIKRPAIYGYGIRGKTLRYVLEMVDMDIACVIDRQSPTVRGIALFNAVQDISEGNTPDIIVVTPVNNANEIAAELRTKVSCPVITVEELANGQN